MFFMIARVTPAVARFWQRLPLTQSHLRAMEEIIERHRKEKRDLQSRITQKKRAATKKNRKSINDECATLELELAWKQDDELACFDIKDDKSNSDDPPHHMVDLADLLTSLPLEQTENQALKNSVQEQSFSKNLTDTASSATESSQRKPNRQKARLARRAAEQEALSAKAAEEAAALPDLKEQERTQMLKQFDQRGLKEQEIAANGHCMYLAIADQMNLLDVNWKPKVKLSNALPDSDSIPSPLDYRTMRQAAASYITAYPDDFIPFIEEPLDEYVHKIRDTAEWGGQLELLALAKTYNLSINVIQSDGRVEEVHGGNQDASNSIWLAYYRHGFGLGEHYNSLRNIPPDRLIAN